MMAKLRLFSNLLQRVNKEVELVENLSSDITIERMTGPEEVAFILKWRNILDQKLSLHRDFKNQIAY